MRLQYGQCLESPFFFFVATTSFRPAVEPIQLPIQWVPGEVLPVEKWRRLSLRLKGTINSIFPYIFRDAVRT